ncbi:gas vesicle protein [Priestia megaterium]
MAAEHNGQLGTIVEVLEKVLDKGLVIAGDIKVQIADVELLTIKIRLLVASIDKAREIGMDWWETDPYLCSKANQSYQKLQAENDSLTQQVASLTQQIQDDLLSLD